MAKTTAPSAEEEPVIVSSPLPPVDAAPDLTPLMFTTAVDPEPIPGAPVGPRLDLVDVNALDVAPPIPEFGVSSSDADFLKMLDTLPDEPAPKEIGRNGFEGWANADWDAEEATPEGEPDAPVVPVAAPLVPGVDPEPAVAFDLTDPQFIESARGMGITVEELAALLGPAAETPEVTPVADPAAPATPPSPAEAALLARLEQLEQTLEATRQEQAQRQQAEAQAQAQAQIAEARAEYEAERRAEYDQQYDFLTDDERAAVVNRLVAADLVVWDGDQSQTIAQQQAEARAQEQAIAQQDAQYASQVETLLRDIPVMATPMAEGYPMANFLADAHRAISYAYGDGVDFPAFAQSFAGMVKQIQTKAYQHGATDAMARLAKGKSAPPVITNKGGGGTPATTLANKGADLSKLTPNNIRDFDMFASPGTTRRK